MEEKTPENEKQESFSLNPVFHCVKLLREKNWKMKFLDKMNIGEDQLQVSQIVSEATLSRKPDFLLGVELKAFLKDDNGIKGRIFYQSNL